MFNLGFFTTSPGSLLSLSWLHHPRWQNCFRNSCHHTVTLKHSVVDFFSRNLLGTFSLGSYQSLLVYRFNKICHQNWEGSQLSKLCVKQVIRGGKSVKTDGGGLCNSNWVIFHYSYLISNFSRHLIFLFLFFWVLFINSS